MKNIVVLGAARSGKSTLAREICHKFGFGIVSIDAMISAFEEIYPQIGIGHHKDCKKLITPFVAAYLNALIYNHPQENFVVEGYHIALDDAVKIFDAKLFDIIVLGYPKLSPEEAFCNIRKYERPYDYTTAMSDEELLSVAKRHVAHSKKCEEDCRLLKLPFYDTSFDRQYVLAKIINTLQMKAK